MSSPQRILGTFDIKPSSAPGGSRPDELMIDWTTLPAGSTAALYLPSLAAADILTAAAGLYGYQPFTAVDPHTVSCPAQGITYLPIPLAPGNIAGLVDAHLPATVRRGAELTVAVSQLTTKTAQSSRGRTGSGQATEAATRARSKPVTWRQVTGVFQLALKVTAPDEALAATERKLAMLRWIFASIPHDSRWRPIFHRYVTAVADQVTGFGGNPADVPASGTLTWINGRAGRKDHYISGANGKIDGLIFDHFGDLEGFILDTGSDGILLFFSREAHVRTIAERAWTARLRVTVIGEDADQHHPRRIILHPAPSPLDD